MRFAATVLAAVTLAATAADYQVESGEFKAGEPMPKPTTCDGEGKSPALAWKTNAASDAKSYALIMDDPDAPSGTFTHWVLFDIPAATRSLSHGSTGVGVLGRNDFKQNAYGAVCPPPGHGVHHYHFRIFALDVEKLGPPIGTTRARVEDAMRGHILGRGELIGTYERK